MTPTSVERRTWRLTLWLGLGVGAVLVGLILARRHTIAVRWVETLTIVNAQHARTESYSPPRLRAAPADRSTTADDDAWVHYAAAIAALDREPPVDSDALASLQRAAAATTARFPVPWVKGFAGDLPLVGGLMRLGEISAAQVDVATRDHDEDLALAQLTDGLQLAVDLLGAGVAIHEVVGVSVLDAHRAAAVAFAQTLDPASQDSARVEARLAALLAAADAAIPSRSESVRTEGALVVRSMTYLTDLFAGSFSWGLWRYAFSAELATAAHVRDTMAMADEIDALLADGTPVARGLVELQARHHQSRNPITRLCAQNLTATLGERLRALTRLRQLRIALAARRGTTLELACPLGGAFRTEPGPGRVRVIAPDDESLELTSTLGQ